MKNRRKKLIMIMSVVLAVLIIIGIVIGVSQVKHKKELEEQGIYYQDGAEGVEDWDEEEIANENGEDLVDDGEGIDVTDGDSENTASSDSDNDNVADTKGDDKDDGKKDDNKKDDNKKDDNKKQDSNKGNSDNGDSDDKKNPVKVPAAGKLTYEEYIAMSPEKQEEYFEKFDSEEDFFAWYREAKAEYDKNNQGNVIEGGSIDIGDYMD